MIRIRPSVRFCIATMLVTQLLSSSLQAKSPRMVEFFLDGRSQSGLALANSRSEMIVIARDGAMHTLDPKRPELRLRPIDAKFSAASTAEVRNELRAEFGPEFEVRSTTNFLVVQPRGRGERWPRLFEQCHRSFVQYMQRRGVKVREGRFPMIAVVFPDENAMYAEFHRQKIDVSRVAGLYSSDSNRVMTHDGGRVSYIAATVRHEAAHQSAFNSGVHSRVNETPRWISEGLGQMFEPPSMASPLSSSQLADRLNRESFDHLQKKFGDRSDSNFAEAVVRLIGDDAMFKNSNQVETAYAISWALMFYLAERDSDAFAAILNHTAARPPFRAYPRQQRLKDFQTVVGSDPIEFSRQVQWFLQSQK